MNRLPAIVMFSMSYYPHWLDGIVNRNWFVYTYISRHQKANTIILIDFLPYNFLSFVRSILFRYRLSRHTMVIRRKFFSTLFCIDNDNRYLIIAPVAYFSKNIFKKQLTNYLDCLDITNPWSWSYNPFDVTFLDKSIFKKSVFDTVDDWRYHSVFYAWKKLLNKNYKYIAFKADTIFGVSRALAHTFDKEWRRNIDVISNGVEYIKNGEELKRKHAAKIVVYLGTLENRIDIALLQKMASEHRDKRFVFIGPIWSTVKKSLDVALSRYSNCKFLGRMPYFKATQYLLSCDVGIVPHKRTTFTSSNDPLKIYDYLAAGLPVVTTQEVVDKSINELLYLSKNTEEFSKNITRAFKENSEEMREKRRRVVMQHHWSNKINRMLTIIEKNA